MRKWMIIVWLTILVIGLARATEARLSNDYVSSDYYEKVEYYTYADEFISESEIVIDVSIEELFDILVNELDEAYCNKLVKNKTLTKIALAIVDSIDPSESCVFHSLVHYKNADYSFVIVYVHSQDFINYAAYEE